MDQRSKWCRAVHGDPKVTLQGATESPILGLVIGHNFRNVKEKWFRALRKQRRPIGVKVVAAEVQVKLR
jgi:hypothetical protein